MGTNYYAVPLVDEGTKEKIKKAIDNDDFGEAMSLMPEKIHIGKSAAGWRFLFNHNDFRYFNADIFAFLKRAQIYDEYGKHISFEDFCKIVQFKSTQREETNYGKMINGINFSNYTEFS